MYATFVPVPYAGTVPYNGNNIGEACIVEGPLQIDFVSTPRRIYVLLMPLWIIESPLCLYWPVTILAVIYCGRLISGFNGPTQTDICRHRPKATSAHNSSARNDLVRSICCRLESVSCRQTYVRVSMWDVRRISWNFTLLRRRAARREEFITIF